MTQLQSALSANAMHEGICAVVVLYRGSEYNERATYLFIFSRIIPKTSMETPRKFPSTSFSDPIRLTREDTHASIMATIMISLSVRKVREFNKIKLTNFGSYRCLYKNMI